MECPYCKREMVKGYLYGESYKLKWLPADKKLVFGYAIGALALESGSYWGRQSAKAYRCLDCNKLIIDINDTK